MITLASGNLIYQLMLMIGNDIMSLSGCDNFHFYTLPKNSFIKSRLRKKCLIKHQSVAFPSSSSSQLIIIWIRCHRGWLRSLSFPSGSTGTLRIAWVCYNIWKLHKLKIKNKIDMNTKYTFDTSTKVSFIFFWELMVRFCCCYAP